MIRLLLCLLLIAQPAFADWGFNASTSILTAQFSPTATSFSMSVWVYILGDGEAGFGQIWARGTSGGQLFVTLATMRYVSDWTTTDGDWRCTRPANSAWTHIAMTYNGSATTNDPVMYVNGAVCPGFAQFGADPAGTFTAAAGTLIIGNTVGSTFTFDGYMGEFGWWDGRILTASEVSSLAKGASPAFYQSSLRCYIPMVRTNIDYKNAPPTQVSILQGGGHIPKPIYPASLMDKWRVSAAAATATPGIIRRRRE